MPRAFITGITGQDGQHLAEFLHAKDYEVFGLVKGQNNPRMVQMRDEFPYVQPVPGDLADLPSLVKALEYAQPDEVYNLGAISFVAMSFNQAELTANITGLGVLRMLEAIRMVGGASNNSIRLYQASSSEMFGKVRETPQTETHPVPPALALRLRQGLRARHRRQLPRELRPVRVQRHSVQPRGPAPWPRVRHAQGHQLGGPHQARAAGGDRARQPRQQARLGLRRRLREGDVADAAAGQARRLRHRHRRDAQHRRVGASLRSPRSASRTGATTSARTRSSSVRPRSTY